MKPLLAVALAVSLALNAAIAVFLFNSGSAPTTPTVTAFDPKASAPGRAAPKIDADVWPSLGGTDLSKLAAQLRASGFPPDLVRAIVAAQISELFTARRKALMPDSSKPSFWKDQTVDPKLEPALRQISKEEQKMLRDILGADAESTDPMARLNQADLTFLSPEKAVDIRAVVREFDERRSDLYAQGTISSEQRVALDKEQRARIAQVLTPEELLEYDLRTSNTARGLRNNLDVFQPTEAEFRAIYQLRAPFEERFSNQDIVAMVAASNGTERRDADKLLTEQIKAALGPQRAEEYTRATDSNYRRTSQLVARLELPPTTADQLWAVQQEFAQRRNALGAVSPAERQQQLAGMKQEAFARIAPLLGNASNVEVYQQYGGQWLQNFVPVPRPPPAVIPKN